MTPELEEVEQAAWTAQYTGLAEVDPDLGPLAVPVAGLHVHGVAGWPESPWHNTVTGAGLRTPLREQALDVALALLARLHAQHPVVQVAEGAEVPPAWLAARGLAPSGPLLRMSAPTGGDPAPEGPLRVEAVGPSAGSTVAAVCLRGFGSVDQRWWRAGLGRDGWTQVVAYAGDVAVATGALFVAGEEAWLGSATTVPDSRRRGAHSALVAARLRLAAEQGARRASVKCAHGSPSHRSLVRAGFTPSHRVMQWRGNLQAPSRVSP